MVSFRCTSVHRSRKYETCFTAFGSRVDFGILKPRLEKNLIIKSFKSCGLNLKADGTKYHLIHCFKECQPCANGLDMLKVEQNLVSNAEYLNSNPFEITESDTEEANTNNNLIDPSDSEDDLIDTEL